MNNQWSNQAQHYYGFYVPVDQMKSKQYRTCLDFGFSQTSAIKQEHFKMNIPEWLLRSVKVNKDWNERIGKFSNIFVHILCRKLTSTGSEHLLYWVTFYLKLSLKLKWKDVLHWRDKLRYGTHCTSGNVHCFLFHIWACCLFCRSSHNSVCPFILCIWSSIPPWDL